jgi:DNA-binding transcriptional ArsR family regulator
MGSGIGRAGDGSMGEKRVEIERVFDALGDPTRRALLEMVRERPQSVSKLVEPLGVSMQAVAQHVDILEACGLVATEKVGRVRTCRMASEGLDALEEWVRAHRSEWEQRLDGIAFIIAEAERPAN